MVFFFPSLSFSPSRPLFNLLEIPALFYVLSCRHCSKRFRRFATPPSISVLSSPPFRYPLCHLIQLQALRSGYYPLLHMEAPGTNLPQQPLRASVEALPSRFVHLRKPILAKQNDTIPSVHCLAQHLFFLWRNSRTHKHASALSACHPFPAQSFRLFLRISPMNNHRFLIRNVEQKPVSNDLAFLPSHHQSLYHREKPRVLPLYHQPSRIVIKVFFPIVLNSATL